MKGYKKRVKEGISIYQVIVMIMVVFLISFIFIGYYQVNYPISSSRMNRFHFSQPGETPDIDCHSVRYFSFIDEEETGLLREEAISSVPPVYYLDQKQANRFVKDFKKFRSLFLSQLEDGLSHEQISKNIERKIDKNISPKLLESIDQSGKSILLLELCENALDRLSQKMLLANSGKDELFVKQGALIRIVKSGKSDALYEDIKMDYALAVNKQTALEISSIRQEVPADLLGHCASLISIFVEPNCYFDIDKNRKAKTKAALKVQPVKVEIEKGETLFLRGQTLTVEQVKKIRALAGINARFEWRKIIFLFVYLAGLFLFTFVLFHPPFIKRGLKNNEINIIQGLMIGGILYSLLVSNIVPSFMSDLAFYFPIPLIVIVVSVMITPRGGFFFGLIYVLIQPLFLLFAAQNSIDPQLLLSSSILFGTIPSLCSAWMVRNLRTLFDFLKSGILITGILFLLSALFLLLIDPFPLNSYQIVLVVTLNGIVITLMAPGLVLVFERFFNILTTHRLVELADTSQPVFRQMISRAPGTYSHSMSVANLAESACQAIGANGLLARVGGYYHDIGKIDQPEYYTENQRFENKHDILKPNLSVTVIKSHVKKGADKARQLKLPSEVVDIIEQHHGNSLILYFYTQAMLGKDKYNIIKDDYRYNSPPPSSVEAAVVMLADCVEAATRSLKSPTPSQVEKFVWKIMLDKLLTEQLNDARLTFQDLQKIKEVFVGILSGQFHTRIEYPGNKDEGSNESN